MRFFVYFFVQKFSCILLCYHFIISRLAYEMVPYVIMLV
jgi:hypothetical protein